MDDQQLLQLIENARQHPYGSCEWQRSMNTLLVELQRLPGLKSSKHQDYLDALNQTWEFVTRNLNNFQPRPPSVQQSLVNWINSYLKWRLKDLNIPSSSTYSLDRPLGDEMGFTLLDQLSETGLSTPSLSGIDGYIEQLQNQENQRIGLEMERVIEEDAYFKLRNLYPQGRPDCNCHVLSKKALLKNPPDKLALLARKLDINYQTLTSHYKRKCLPCLQKMATELKLRPNPPL